MLIDYFHELMQSLPEAGFLLSEAGEIQAVNAAAARLLEKEATTLVGRCLAGLVSDEADRISRFLRICSRNGQNVPGSLTWHRGNDTLVACRCNGRLLRSGVRGTVPLILLLCEPRMSASSRFIAVNRMLEELKASHHKLLIEIAERRRVEDSLRESEERYHRIVNAVTNYTYSVELEQGRTVSTRHSAGCLALTGYAPEDYAADPNLWYSMVLNEDKGILEDMLRKLYAGQDVSPIEHRLIRSDNRVIWVRNTIAPSYDEKGLLVRYDGMIENITERKEKEAEIARLNETLEQRVNERTAEMAAMLKSYVDRELRMAELKEKIADLEKKR